jgi:hypothetical protein
MSKSRKRDSIDRFFGYDGFDTHRKTSNTAQEHEQHRKEKRIKNALRSRNVSELLEEDQEEYYA